MSNIGIFETSIRKLLPSNENVWAKDVTILVSHACDIDRLRERCASDARDISKRFEKFASLVEEGQFFSEPSPQSHYELTRNMAMLQGHTNVFKVMINNIFREEEKKIFWSMISEAFSGVRGTAKIKP